MVPETNAGNAPDRPADEAADKLSCQRTHFEAVKKSTSNAR
jgi:hypothetical protein